MKTVPKKIMKLAKKIRLIATDVDGVLTGGEIIILKSGEEVKLWSVKDRFAFHLLERCGGDIKCAWISGRASHQTEEQAVSIGIDAVIQDCMNKKEAIEELSRRFKVGLDEIAYIGDDLVDIPVLKCAGLSVCPADAPEEVSREVDFISGIPGGKGVFREVSEIVLKSRGLWKKATQGYL